MRPFVCPSCGKQLHECECEEWAFPIIPRILIAMLIGMSALIIIGAEIYQPN